MLSLTCLVPFVCVLTLSLPCLQLHNKQIIGADMIDVRGPKDAEFGSRRFIEALRKDERYRQAMIVGMVENTGDNNYPQFWHDWWRNYPPYMSAVNLAHPL